LLNTLTANNCGYASNSTATLARQRAVITRASSGTSRRTGGPSLRSHFAIVAG
jgi:hypothetical protein